MSGQPVEKICVRCGTDVSRLPRSKDRKGRYWCQGCYQAALREQEARRAEQEAIPLADDPDAQMMAALLDEQVHESAPATPCPACHALMQPGTVVCTACGYNVETGQTRAVAARAEKKAGKRTKVRPDGTTARSVLLTSLAACAVAGVVGVVVWAGVALELGVESSWIAIGVGALVGFAGLLGARGNNDEITGALAALITMCAIFGGKYAAVSIGIDRLIDRPIDEEYAIDVFADVIQDEAGQDVSFRRRGFRVTPNISRSQARLEAANYWMSLTPEERAETLAELQADAEEQGRDPAALKWRTLEESMGGMDWFFVGIGILVAFGVGSGAEWYSDD